MSLHLAAASLTQRMIGLADIKQFATQCQDGARRAEPEAAALILLSAKANSFYERYEGVAMTNDALHTFVKNLETDVRNFRVAATSGDDALIKALNAFAVAFSSHLAYRGNDDPSRQ